MTDIKQQAAELTEKQINETRADLSTLLMSDRMGKLNELCDGTLSLLREVEGLRKERNRMYRCLAYFRDASNWQIYKDFEEPDTQTGMMIWKGEDDPIELARIGLAARQLAEHNPEIAKILEELTGATAPKEKEE